jgi:exodeoxyribonuclease VII large subunit
LNESLFQALFEEVVERRPMTVSELNAEIKASVEDAFARVWVEGEIVNYRKTASGHCYFSLNDGSAQVKAVIWKSANPRIRFDPQDGMNVQIRGRMSYWSTKGELKLQVDSMQPAGEGSLAIAFEQVRMRLEADGLLHELLKRPLPKFPRRVGVVTSATGAAFADVVHVLSRRAASVSVLLFPATVQGEGAADDICAAIDRANRLHSSGEIVDVLIVGRGGGSAEDLWAFNDEKLARAIRASGIPVISAVGHEIDTTIADLIADHRAATPSAAAEMVAQHEDDIRALLDRSAVGLTNLLNHRLRIAETALIEASRRLYTAFGSSHVQTVTRFENLTCRLSLNLIDRHRERCEVRVNELARRQLNAARAVIGKHTTSLEKDMARLDALSPLRVLERGYSVTQNAKGEVIRQASQVSRGEALKIRLADGKLNATVTSIE